MGSTTSDGQPPESDVAGWLQTFVPPIALELAGGVACPGHVAVDGSVLSADIAGFTSLAERLATSGKEGSEQLNVVVNSRIRALIDVSQRYGGGILKFGGDGILVLFKDEGHAHRAVATGLEMHRALAEFDATSDKSPELADEALSISVGIAEGPFDLFLVGNSEAKDLLIAGPAADAVVALESAAESGETVVSAATAIAVGAATDGAASRGGGFVLSEDGANVDDLMAPADRDPHPLEIVRPYVRSAVATQVRVDQPLGGEHRLAAVGFVAVSGVSDRLTQGNIGAVTADLSRLFETVVNICERTGVHLLETDIHPGGIKFLLAAGVPISHSNPSDAMLTAALDIVAMQSSMPGLGISCGVSRGRLFGALVGSPTRHSFTVVGDDTNIAARLANAANDGTVVATKRALNRARAVFTSETLGPMTVKGKAMPIDCVTVSSRPVEAKASSRAAQFVGRAEEVTALTDALASTGATLLVGGPGVGKTSLLAEAIHRTTAQGIFVVQATCSPLENTSPYGVTRELLRKIIGIDLYASDEDAGEQLHKVVAGEAPSMLDLLPLLATAMRATVPLTATVDALADEFRRERTEEVVVEFVNAMRFGQPLSIVIDDLQWIDEASSGVISALAGAATSRGWSVIGSRRPSADEVPVFEPGSEITLDLQPDDEIRRIIIANSPEPLGDHALNRLVARAAGSPLFAEQLAAAVADGGAGSATAELPESVEQLLTTRFDHLDPDVRHVVRTASVFGQQGELDELTAVSDVPGAAGLLERADGFVTVVPHDDGGGRFVFESQLHRDTAYEGLAYSDRRRLHLAIGEHMEISVSAADRSDELARHFSLAGDEERGWTYGVQAAERAAASYAWVDAAAVLRRVLDQAGTRSADELASLAELRGEYLLSASSYADAEDAFAEAISLNPKSPRVASRSIRSATAVLRQGRYSEALETLGALLEGSDLGTADRAEAMMAMCSAHFAQNELEDAYKLAVDVLAIADVELDPLTVARAEMRVHAISDGTGRSHEEHGARALALFQEHNDLALAAEVTNNLGAAAYYAGDWETAELRYREALELKIRAGDYSGASVARANLAELLIERGMSADVDELLFESERNFEASGLAAGVLFIAVLKGRLLLLLDEPGDAAALFEEVAATYLRYEAHASALETSGYQAEALLIAGDIDRADELSASVVEQIREQSESFEDRDRSLCRIELVRGAVKASSSPIIARGHWREAASLAEASGADDLANVAACLLATSDEQRAEPLDALRRRGIEKVPLLEHLGRGFS